MRRGKLPQGQALEDRARDLGVSLHETIDSSGGHAVLREPELQRRVLEAERSLREHRLWWLALVSAVASAISAAGAWRAVMCR
jgi:hypothetical protein